MSKVKEKRSADIMATLAELSRGRFMLQAGIKLGELNEAIIATGTKGKLTIVLEVSAAGMRDGRVGQLEIRPKVSITKPDHTQAKSIFFVTEDGVMTRDDPSQMDMSFVSTEEEAPKEHA